MCKKPATTTPDAQLRENSTLWFAVMNCILEKGGANDYEIPHCSKEKKENAAGAKGREGRRRRRGGGAGGVGSPGAALWWASAILERC